MFKRGIIPITLLITSVLGSLPAVAQPKEYSDSSVRFNLHNRFQAATGELGPHWHLKAGSNFYGDLYIKHLSNPKHAPLSYFANLYEKDEAEKRSGTEVFAHNEGHLKRQVAGVVAWEDDYTGANTKMQDGKMVVMRMEQVWCYFVPEKNGNVLRLEFSFWDINGGPMSQKSKEDFFHGAVDLALNSLQLL